MWTRRVAAKSRGKIHRKNPLNPGGIRKSPWVLRSQAWIFGMLLHHGSLGLVKTGPNLERSPWDPSQAVPSLKNVWKSPKIGNISFYFGCEGSKVWPWNFGGIWVNSVPAFLGIKTSPEETKPGGWRTIKQGKINPRKTREMRQEGIFSRIDSGLWAGLAGLGLTQRAPNPPGP